MFSWAPLNKDMGGSQRDNDSSPNLSFNDLKQKEIEIKEGSARVLWYETQLLIGQPNGGSPKFQGGSPKLFFSQRGTGTSVRCEELLNGVKVGLLSDWLRGIQFHIMLSLFSLVESSHWTSAKPNQTKTLSVTRDFRGGGGGLYIFM